MNKIRNVAYVDAGHQGILQHLQQKHDLSVVRTFNSHHSVCSLATTPAGDQLFIKVKGYQKNSGNERRFRRAVSSNRMASMRADNGMPRLVDFLAFERPNGYWLATLSAYGGEPFAESMFFTGDEALVDDDVVGRIRRSILGVQRTPAASIFYPPAGVAKMVLKAFGQGAGCWASDWTSAHCDFHWANILQGGHHVVDWDMFSLAPKGFDAASIVLFSASKTALFERVHHALGDLLDSPSARVATAFAAARLLAMMKSDAYSDMRVFEPNVREAARIMLGSDMS